MSQLLFILLDMFLELPLGSSWSVTGNLLLQKADCWSVSPQTRLLLLWSPATSLVCHWSVGQVGGRGLLHESWLLRHLKGPFYQQDRDRGSETALPWQLSNRYQGWCMDGYADRGRRVVRKSGWLIGGRGCDVMWVSPHIYTWQSWLFHACSGTQGDLLFSTPSSSAGTVSYSQQCPYPLSLPQCS